MANDPVELTVRSQLKKVIADLQAIAAANQKVRQEFLDTGKQIDTDVTQNIKRTESYLKSLRSLSRRVGDQMRSDFRSLLSLSALRDATKLSQQFSGSIRETLTLTDTIRKLGTTFGLTSRQYEGFQARMVKGLGLLGLSSEVGTQALQGLAGTPVRGESNLLEYAQRSGELASVGGQPGREADIAKGIAEVLRARGADPNDMREVRSVAEDLRRVRNQTGASPVQTLESMRDLFAAMPQDLRRQIGTRGLANLAAVGQVGGPNSTQFLQEFLSKSPIDRMALEQQGFRGVFGQQGLDVDRFSRASQAVRGRIGGDPRMAAQTLGISEQAAEGFIRLTESLDAVRKAQHGIAAQTGDLDQQYRDSMGPAEAFRASINRVKRVLATPLSALGQGAAGLLGRAAQSDGGAAAVVAGGGVLAALLAGFGLRGIGKGLGGGLLAGAAAEGITGRQVVPVYVVNAGELGAAGGLATAGAAAGGVTTALGVTAAAAGGLLAGRAAEGIMASGPESTGSALRDIGLDRLGDAVTRLGKQFQEWSGRLTGMYGGAEQRVRVELNPRELREVKPPSRGASH